MIHHMVVPNGSLALLYGVGLVMSTYAIAITDVKKVEIHHLKRVGWDVLTFALLIANTMRFMGLDGSCL